MSREWNAEAYQRLSRPQLAWGKRVLQRVESLPLRGNELILDAGCGTGKVTAELLRLNANIRVVGLDLSANMLQRAAANLKPDIGTRVTLVCSDLSHVPFNAVFDGVFSTAAFHWVTDHPGLFNGLYRALKPGGWLIAQCGGGPNIKNLRDRARDLQGSPRFRSFFEDWVEPWEYASAETTAARLRASGFTQVETWLERAYLSLDSPAEYREYLQTVTIHRQLERITNPKLRDEFLDELTQQAISANDFELDYWRLNMNARRPD